MLTHPAPPLAKLGADLRRHYDFLRAMTAEERQWGRGDARDRGEVLRAVAALPDVALDPAHLR